MMVVDKDLARELVLFSENDYDLYRSHIVPLSRNYGRKKYKGEFDKELAIKGIENNTYRFARERYEKETGVKLPSFDKETKRMFAEDLYDSMFEESSDEYADELRKLKNINDNNKNFTNVKAHSRFVPSGQTSVRQHSRRLSGRDLMR